jgi:surface polysaccharide O-acyltransferase-like enzyme
MSSQDVVLKPTPARAPAPPPRRGELDLLRALIVVGLVFFHTAVIFGAGEFPVKAEQENQPVTVLLGFGAAWGMPLLFLISGMGAFYSLRRRDAAAFARERVRRLLVPLLTGLLVLVPIQVYLGLRRSGQAITYADFYRRFLDVRLAADFPFLVAADPGGGLFQTGHLWFLVCLLAFSLALLPGFLFLRRPAGTRLAHRLGGLLARPSAIFLPVLPLAAVEMALGSEVGLGAWNRYSYAIFLVYGYLAAADARIGEAFQRHWRLAAGLALLGFVAAGAVFTIAQAGGDPLTDHDQLSLAFRLLKTADGWLWLVAILGLARSLVARPRATSAPAPTATHRTDRARARGRWSAYANDAVLPFYLLHETVIVVVAYHVLAWEVGAAAQYGLIACTSLVLTWLLYDLAVRRTAVTRFLFGR